MDELTATPAGVHLSEPPKWLEAILEPGDPPVIDGDNQKQTDFLAAALANADPARLQVFQVANSTPASSELKLSQ